MILRAAISVLLFATAVRSQEAPVMPTRAEPPEASFTVVDGWLQIRLLDAGKPMAGAKIACLVDRRLWADGLTGENGEGSFPKPNAEYCQLIFDLGAGPSAPIPLTFLKDGTAIPTSAAVRDGTAECCMLSSPKRTAFKEDGPGIAALALIVAIALSSAIAALAFLRIRSAPVKSPTHWRTKRAR